MTALTDSNFILLMLPEGVTFAKNGLDMDPPSVVDSVLAMPEVNGVKELALATLFEMLESDQLQSETIGRYSYSRWKMRGSDYWKIQTGSMALGNAAPKVVVRGYPGRCW